jgi:DNA gyrase inhibitor GyrI
MVGAIHGVSVKPSDVDELRTEMMTMPAHPDVVEGLRRLKEAGFRMATLTNSPPNPKGKSPLEHAGLADFFERQFSIETARAYKPAQMVYHMVAQELDVRPSSCCMVAAHVWDTVRAQSAGLLGALITRPGNALLPVYEETDAAYERLMAWAGMRGLLKSPAVVFGIAYDDPTVTTPDKLRYDAALVIPENVASEGDVGVQTIQGGKYAVTTHCGPHEAFGETYARFCGEWLPLSGLELLAAPALEFYRNSPHDTPPDQLLTDIYMPLAT